MAGPPPREPQEPSVSGLADPTRDIRLPPLPGRPPPAVPPEWEGVVPERSAEPSPAETVAERPTDELGDSSASAGDRDPTLTFDGSSRERWAAGHAATPDPAWSAVPGTPGPAVTGRRRPRRWPWIVLTLVPVVVIVVTGVWLLLLMW